MRAWLLPVALLAAPAAARFAPIPDATYRLSAVAERTDDKGTRRFATDYDIVFARDAGEWRVTMTLRPDSVADTRGTATFFSLQDGTPLVVRLDRRGRLIAIEDRDARWARLRAAIDARAAGKPGHAALLAIHDSADDVAKARGLAGDVLDLCAGDDAERREGTRTTVLPATQGAPLPVTEITVRTHDAVVVTTRDAAGDLVRTRTIDRHTGLVRESVERRRITAGSSTATTLRTATLTPQVSFYPSGTARKP